MKLQVAAYAHIQIGTQGQTAGSGVAGWFSPSSLGYPLTAEQSNLPFSGG